MLIFDVLKRFNLLDEAISNEKYGRGRINRTYVFESTNQPFVLQMINNKVFKEPKKVVENLLAIRDYLCETQKAEKYRFCRTLIRADNGDEIIEVNNTYWRAYRLQGNTKIHKKILNSEMMYQIGKGLGSFHKALLGFDKKKLNVTIPHFHNTYKHYQKLEEQMENDPFNTALPVFNEYKFLRDRRDEMKIVHDAIESKKIPTRVAHNNIRLNNILFDAVTNEFVSLVGFDAIMEGSIVYDVGEAIKYLASTVREDEKDLSLVKINLEYVQAFFKGYLEEANTFLTKEEIELIPLSIKIMALENAILYLDDYINGEMEYSVDYKGQNLDRARNQMKLVEEIELVFNKIRMSIINNKFISYNE